MSTTLANVQMKSTEALAAKLENLNISQTNIMSNGLQRVAQQLEITNKYQEAMLDFMNKNISPTNQSMLSIAPIMGEKLEQIASVLNDLKQSPAFSSIGRSSSNSNDPMAKFLSDGAGFNIGSYSKMVKENLQSNPVGMAFQLLGMMREDGVKSAVKSFMPMITKFGVKGLIGSKNLEKYGDLDKQLASALRSTLYRVGDLRNSDNMIKSAIGEIFGVARNQYTRVDLSKARKDEVIGWNGIAQRTLVEVIPSLLSSMEKAITKRDDRVLYNYETGMFMTNNEAIKDLRNKQEEIFQSAFDEIGANLMAAGAKNGSTDRQMRELFKTMNELLHERITQNKGFDSDYKARVNLAVSKAGIRAQDGYDAIIGLEGSIEKLVDSMNQLHENISAENSSALHYRQIMNNFDESARETAEKMLNDTFENMQSRYLERGRVANILNPNATDEKTMEGALFSILSSFGNNGKTAREGLKGFKRLQYNTIDTVQEIIRTAVADNKSVRKAMSKIQNESEVTPSANIESAAGNKFVIPSYPKNNSGNGKAQDAVVSTADKAIIEDINSNNSVSILKGVANDIHSKLLVPMYANIFSKDGLLRKFFSDDPDSEFNKFKERLFGKEKGILTPMVDFLKYKLTGKGYTSRNGTVYEDTDDNVWSNIKKGYGIGFNGLMTYMFGEKYKDSDAYKDFWYHGSPEAFAERKAKREEEKERFKEEVDRYIRQKNADKYQDSVGSGRRRAVGYGFGQRDPRWANTPTGVYNDGTIATMATAGCGPTALANIAQLFGKNVSPVDMLSIGQSNGYMVDGGSGASLFTKGAAKIGLKGNRTNLTTAFKALAKGIPSIVAGKSSKRGSIFSREGHIVSMIGRSGNNVIIIDPETGDPSIIPMSEIRGKDTHVFTYGRSLGYGIGEGAYGEDDYGNRLFANMESAQAWADANDLKVDKFDIGIDGSIRIIGKRKPQKKAKGEGSSTSTRAHVYDGKIDTVIGLLTDLPMAIKDVLSTDTLGININIDTDIDRLVGAIFDIPRLLTDKLRNELDVNGSFSNEIGFNLNGIKYALDEMMKFNTNTYPKLEDMLSTIAYNTEMLGYFMDEFKSMNVDYSNNIEEVLNNISEAVTNIGDTSINRYINGSDEELPSSAIIDVLDNSLQARLNRGELRGLKGSVDARELAINLGPETVETLQEAGIEVGDKTTNTEAKEAIIEAHAKVAADVVKTGKEMVDITIGKPEEDKKSLSESFRSYIDKIKKDSGKILTGTIGGAAVGGLNALGGGFLTKFFLPGGPISGALAGTALSLVTRSEKFQNFMFGEEKDGERSGGLISKNLMDTFKKALPFAVGGATLGIIKSLIGATIGFGGSGPHGIIGKAIFGTGPIGAAVIGLGLGILKYNDTIKSMLFGDKDDNGQRTGKALSSAYNKVTEALTASKGWLKKGAAGLGLGLVASATIGQMGALGSALTLGGPIGASIAGLALGIASNSDRFKTILFGSEYVDKDGNIKRNKDGLLNKAMNGIMQHAIYPIKGIIEDRMQDFGMWASKNIALPFKLAFGPVIDSFKDLKSTISEHIKAGFDKITDGIGGLIRTGIGTALKPISWLARKTVDVGTKALSFEAKLLGGLLSAPLKMGAALTGSKRAKAQRKFRKTFRDHIGDKWDYEDTIDPETGMNKWGETEDGKTLKGRFIRGWSHFRDALGMPIYDDETEKLYEGWGIGMKNMGLDTLSWFEAKAKEKNLEKKYNDIKKDRKRFRSAESMMSEWAAEDKYLEDRKWTNKLIKERSQALSDLGLTMGISSEEDIKQLMYHRRDWQAKYGKYGTEDLTIKESNLDPKEEAAIENTTQYQNTMTQMMADLLSFFVSGGESFGYEERARLTEYKATKRYNEYKKNLERSGYSEEDVMDSSFRKEDIMRLDADMLGYMATNEEGDVDKKYKHAFKEYINANIMPKTYEDYLIWHKLGEPNIAKFEKDKKAYTEVADKISNGANIKVESTPVYEEMQQAAAKVNPNNDFVQKMNLQFFASKKVDNSVSAESGNDVYDRSSQQKILDSLKGNPGAQAFASAMMAVEGERVEFEEKKVKEAARAEKEAKQSESVKGGTSIDRNDEKKEESSAILDWLKYDKNGNKRKGFIGGILNGIGNTGTLLKNSMFARVIAVIGAYIFRDQIVSGAKALNNVFTEYLPKAYNVMKDTVIPFLFDNISNVAEFAIKAIPEIGKGIYNGVLSLSKDFANKIGLYHSSNKYSASDVDLSTGLASDGQQLLQWMNPETGQMEYVMDGDQYQSLGENQYLASDGTVRNISKGTGYTLTHAGVNALRNGKTAAKSLKFVGGAIKLPSALLKNVPIVGNVFKATDAIGTTIYNTGKGLNTNRSIGEALQEWGAKSLDNHIKSAASTADTVIENAAKNSNTIIKLDDYIKKSAKNNVDDVARAAATKQAKGLMGLLSKAANKFSNICDGTYFGKFVDIIKNSLDTAIKKASGTKLGKFVSDLASGLGKGVVKFAPIIGTAFTVYDFVKGFTNAESLFGVPDGEADGTMKMISALFNTALGLGIGPLIDIAFVFISEVLGTNIKQDIAVSLYEFAMNLVGNTNAISDLKDNQQVLQMELDNYNAAHPTADLTLQEYQDLKKENKSWFNKFKNATGWFGGGVKEDFSQYEVTTSQKRAAGIKVENVNTTEIYNMYMQKVGDGTSSDSVGNGIGYGYAQNDPRWAKYPLGKFKNGKVATMDIAGCGPTALAAVATELSGQNVSPVQVANIAKSNGYITDGGANTKLFNAGARKLGLNSEKINPSSIMTRLRNGEKIIVSGNSVRTAIGYGDSIFTPAGHIVTLEGAVGDSVMVNDPQTGMMRIVSIDNIAPDLTNAWSIGYGKGRRKFSSFIPGQNKAVGYGDVTEFKELHQMLELNDILNAISYVKNTARNTTTYDGRVETLEKSVLDAFRADNYNNKMEYSFEEYVKSGYAPDGYDANIPPNFKYSLANDPDFRERIYNVYREFMIMANPEYNKYLKGATTEETYNNIFNALINRGYNSNLAKYFANIHSSEKTSSIGTIQAADPKYYIEALKESLGDDWYNQEGVFNGLTIDTFLALSDKKKGGDSELYNKSIMYRYLYDAIKPHRTSANKDDIISNDYLKRLGLYPESLQELLSIIGYDKNSLSISNLPYGIINGIPYYSMYDSRWRDNDWKGGKISNTGADLASLAMILTAFSIGSSGTNRTITPQYMLQNWFNANNPSWYSNTGFSSTFFSRNGLQSLAETYDLYGKPLNISSVNSAKDAITAMRDHKLVLMKGVMNGKYPVFGDSPNGKEHYLVGTYANDAGFVVTDPNENVQSKILPLSMLNSSILKNAIVFSNSDGSGLKSAAEMNFDNPETTSSAWEDIISNVKNEELGYLSALVSGLLKMGKNLINSIIGGVAYKSIFDSSGYDTTSLSDTELDSLDYISDNGIDMGKDMRIKSSYVESILNGTAEAEVNRDDTQYTSSTVSSILKNQLLGINSSYAASVLNGTTEPVVNRDDTQYTSSPVSSDIKSKLSAIGNSLETEADAYAREKLKKYGYPEDPYYKDDNWTTAYTSYYNAYIKNHPPTGGEDDTITGLEGVIDKVFGLISDRASSEFGINLGSGNRYYDSTENTVNGMATNIGLVSYAEALYNEHAKYVWGASCKRFTEAYRDQLIKEKSDSSHPAAYYTGRYNLFKNSIVTDCSGVIRGYVGGVAGTAQNLYNTSTKKGSTSEKMPTDVPGILVFKGSTTSINHVGILDGKGNVLHCTGSGNMTKETFKTGSWSHWGRCKYITYVSTDPFASTPDVIASKLNDGTYTKATVYDAIGYGNAIDPISYLTSSLGGTVTQKVGVKYDPISGSFIRHRGTDIAARENTSIHSPVSGKVVENKSAGYGSPYGNYMVVKDGSGDKHLMAHLKYKSPLSVGSNVYAGEEIGKIGSTGRSTGPHLHYEMRRDNHIIDPLSNGKISIMDAKFDDVMARKSSPTGGQDDILKLANQLSSKSDTSDVVELLKEIITIMKAWADVDEETRSKLMDAISKSASNLNLTTNNITNTGKKTSNSSSSDITSMSGRKLHEIIASKERY